MSTKTTREIFEAARQIIKKNLSSKGVDLSNISSNITNNVSEISESGIILKQPYNPTDLKVIVDPAFERNSMIKLYNESSNGGAPIDNGKWNPLLVDGCIVPVVQVNGYNVATDNIIYIDLDFTGFSPTKELEINDENGIIRSSANTGMNNMINIVITSPVDGVYRKIFCEFYITSQPYPDGSTVLKYKGTYKYNIFNTIVIRDLCESHKNGVSQSSSFSTYDTFERVANLTKFGFAATGGCKDVADIDLRILEGETFIDFLKRTIKYSGLDETSMFDAWIDGHGYLCLANVYWIMNSNVDPSQLTLDIITGVPTEQISTEHHISTTGPRMITNSRNANNTSNIYFTEYSHDIDLSLNREHGTSHRYYTLCPISVSEGNNGIQETNIQQIENSLDGNVHTDSYEFQKKEYLGPEFTERHIKLQSKIRDNYFTKLRADRLVVTLVNTNLGLERGMLVLVNIQECDTIRLTNMRSNLNNIDDSSTTNDNINKNVVGNEGVEGISLESDLYYIDGERFIYNRFDHKIQQVLYLIKKGPKINIHSQSTSVESNKDQMTSAQVIWADIEERSSNPDSQLFNVNS